MMRRLAAIAVLVAAMLPSGARADLVLSLDNPWRIASAGSTVDFYGSLTNSGLDTLFLNGADYQLSPEAAADVSPFLSGAPFWLDPYATGTWTWSGLLFSITLPTEGDYGGTFTVLGGADSSAFEPIGSANFVVRAPSAVPEASSMSLLLAGLAAPLAVMLRRRHR